VSASSPIKLGEQTFEWRRRPLSAAANYYLAARTVAAVPFIESSVALGRLRDRAVELLGDVEGQPGGETRHRVRRVAAGWRSALATERGLAPGSRKGLERGTG